MNKNEIIYVNVFIALTFFVLGGYFGNKYPGYSNESTKLTAIDAKLDEVKVGVDEIKVGVDGERCQSYCQGQVNFFQNELSDRSSDLSRCLEEGTKHGITAKHWDSITWNTPELNIKIKR